MGRDGGFTPSTAPTGWVFLDRRRAGGVTIRWKRGDSVAYVLSGARVGDHGMTEVLDTLPVLPGGWTDLAEVRHVMPISTVVTVSSSRLRLARRFAMVTRHMVTPPGPRPTRR